MNPACKNEVDFPERMTSLPKVTINIPAYNQEKYIARAIESCLAQDYPHLEIIVSDDCSNDKTFAVAQKYATDSRIKLFRNEKNIGRVKHYRKILHEYSRGEWVVNLDGDDYYIDNRFISEAIHLIHQHPQVVMYAAAAKVFIEKQNRVVEGTVRLKQVLTLMKGTDYVLNAYEVGNIMQHFACLYNRAIALQTDFYSHNSLGSDTDSLCRLAFKGNVLVHLKYVGVWTSHENNASYTLNMDTLNSELSMFRSIADAAKSYMPASVAEQWYEKRKKEKLQETLIESYARLPLKKAIRLYRKNFSLSLQNLKELIKFFLRAVHLR